MQNQLGKILSEAKEQIRSASSVADTEEIRVRLLGKKGALTEILRSMGKLTPEERKEVGLLANNVRNEIEALLEDKFAQVKNAAREERFRMEKIDVTEPGFVRRLGVKHPLTITIEEISRVFMSMGFSIAEGPEVETVFNNFDALNSGRDVHRQLTVGADEVERRLCVSLVLLHVVGQANRDELRFAPFGATPFDGQLGEPASQRGVLTARNSQHEPLRAGYPQILREKLGAAFNLRNRVDRRLHSKGIDDFLLKGHVTLLVSY